MDLKRRITFVEGVVAESPHTHLLQMNLHSTAGPCCAARKMSGISMLYLDQVPLTCTVLYI
jgi:hypothetical protein